MFQGIRVLLVLLLTAGTAYADQNREWTHHGGSPSGLQYSSIDQINPGNVRRLKEVWRFRTGELGQDSAEGYSFQANPIVVRGALYVSTGSSIIVAVNPATGKELWRFDPHIDRSKNTAETSNRGVNSWIDERKAEDEQCFHTIYTGTLDGRMIAVDGATGQPCIEFGNNGQVDLSEDVRLTQSDGLEYGITSPPVIVGDTLVSGSAVGDNRGVEIELGIVHALDARTGERRWRFDPIPRDGKNPMHGGWNPQQVKKASAANAWAPLAADSELGLIYVPTGSVSPDFYGGEREGDNRYANSLVALDVNNGAVVWHQQLVHHDVWDFDLPAQPTLVELQRDGRTIPAVIQSTKMGMLFTFDRRTGEPIFGMEERPVPQGGVLGEHLSKTQPFPPAPPPLMSHAPVSPDDAWGLLWFDEWACGRKFSTLRSEGIYTPPSLEGTLLYPSYVGGGNWGGIAFDPDRQIVIVNTMQIAAEVQLIERNEFLEMARSGDYPESEFAFQQGTPYGMRRQMLLSPLGVPCSAPPWGRLSAVDMRAGTILWQVPLGTIEDLVPAFVPALELGVPNIGGPIMTASGITFIAATSDNYLRAFDVETGKELWKGRLPAGGQATPMTYMVDGRQYVVIAAGGHLPMGTTPGDYVVAFALAE